MSDPGAGPSYVGTTLNLGEANNTARQSNGAWPFAGSTALPNNMASTSNNITKPSVKILPWSGKIGVKKNLMKNRKMAAIKTRVVNHRTKYLQSLQEMRKMRLFETIENKIKRIEKRKSLLEGDIVKLTALVMKDTKIENNNICFIEKASKELNEIKKKIILIKQKESEKQAEINGEIQEMIRIELQTKNNIEAMKKYQFEKKNEIEAVVLKMKDKEAEINIDIENDIKNMQTRLATKEKEFVNNIKAMQKYEAEKTSEIKSKIKRMESKEAKLNIHIENKIKNMETRLAMKEKELETNIKAMRKREDEKLGEIKAKIKQIESKEATLKIDVENKIKNMQTKLATKEKELETNITAMRKNEDEKLGEIKAKIKQMEYKEAKLKIDIENNIKNMQIMSATKEKELDNKIKAMRKTEAERTGHIKAKINKNDHKETRTKIKICNSEESRRSSSVAWDEEIVCHRHTSATPHKSPGHKALQLTTDRNLSDRSTPRIQFQQKLPPKNFFVRVNEEPSADEDTKDLSLAWDGRTESVYLQTSATPHSPRSRMPLTADTYVSPQCTSSNFYARVKHEPTPDEDTMDITISSSNTATLWSYQ